MELRGGRSTVDLAALVADCNISPAPMVEHERRAEGRQDPASGRSGIEQGCKEMGQAVASALAWAARQIDGSRIGGIAGRESPVRHRAGGG